jgi:hypothetical protein
MQCLEVESFSGFSQVDGKRSDQIGHMVSVIDYLRESYPQPSDTVRNVGITLKFLILKGELWTNWPLKEVDMTFDLAKTRSPGYVFINSWDQVFHSPMWRGGGPWRDFHLSTCWTACLGPGKA